MCILDAMLLCGEIALRRQTSLSQVYIDGVVNASSLFGRYVCYDACIRPCSDVARRNWFRILYSNYFELHTLVMWARGGVVVVG